MILCKLFKNLLSYYDLDYTLNVFKHEINDKEDISEKELLKRIGIDLEDNSRPYLFQLLEREEKKSNTNIEREKMDENKKGGKAENNTNRDPKSDNKSNTNNSKDFQIQRPSEKISHIIENIKKTESEIRLTEENNDDESENDVFLSESIGIDLTVDSEALQQFDYEESLEAIE